MEATRKILFYILLVFGLFLMGSAIGFHIWALSKGVTPPYPWMTGFISGLLYLVLAGGIYYEQSKICLYGLILLSAVWVGNQSIKLFTFANERLLFYTSLFYVTLHLIFLVLALTLLRKKTS